MLHREHKLVVAYDRGTMRDGKNRDLLVEDSLHAESLILQVKCRGCFVHDDKAGLRIDHACKTEPLLLAGREHVLPDCNAIEPPISDYRLEACVHEQQGIHVTMDREEKNGKAGRQDAMEREPCGLQGMLGMPASRRER